MHFNTLFVHVWSWAIPKFEISNFVVQAARLFWQMLSAVIHLHGNRVCLPGFFWSRDTGAQFPQLFSFGSTLLRLFTATSSWTSSKSPFADTILDHTLSYHIPYQSISYIPAFIYVSLRIPHTCQYDMLYISIYLYIEDDALQDHFIFSSGDEKAQLKLVDCTFCHATSLIHCCTT